MTKFVIQGGRRLAGTIEVAANKNAILPMMAASLLTRENCVIRNVPHIADVKVMADLLRSVGATVVSDHEEKTLTINTRSVSQWAPSEDLVEKMRASVLLAGPLLARFGRWSMRHPGGDAIGTRSIRTHLEAFKHLGATVHEHKAHYDVELSKVTPNTIFLDEQSVTATENLMLVASHVSGTTVIRNAACEPHIENLATMLRGMGANIEGAGTNVLKITGCLEFGPADCDVWPDHTEAGTFAALAAACAGGEVIIHKARREHLEMVLVIFDRMGVDYDFSGSGLKIRPAPLKAIPQIVTGPWPNFPTDLASVFIVLATQAAGMTMMHDWMYESRMFFIDRLKEMGARIVLADPHRCVISGGYEMHGREFVSPDIRAGIALVMASLIAQGQSVIDHVELIDRGYEWIDERLRKLGASIERVP